MTNEAKLFKNVHKNLAKVGDKNAVFIFDIGGTVLAGKRFYWLVL